MKQMFIDSALFFIKLEASDLTATQAETAAVARFLV